MQALSNREQLTLLTEQTVAVFDKAFHYCIVPVALALVPPPTAELLLPQRAAHEP
jgi:hypothetical protein